VKKMNNLKKFNDMNLIASEYPCMGETFPGIDYSQSRCVKKCLYCGLSGYNTNEKMIASGYNAVVDELSSGKYKGVYISPYTDAFLSKNKAKTHKLLVDILSKGLVALLNTKQVIPTNTIDVLEEYKRQIIVQYSLPSINDELIKRYEPGCANVKERLSTIKKITDKNIPVIGLVIPWPDVYSKDETINDLPRAMAHAGIKKVIASAGTFTYGCIGRLRNSGNELLKQAASKSDSPNHILLGEGNILRNKVNAYERLHVAFKDVGIKFNICGTALNPDLIEKQGLMFEVCTKIKHRRL